MHGFFFFLEFSFKVCFFGKNNRSLSPLFDNPKLDKELRILLRENFPEFCSQDGENTDTCVLFHLFYIFLSLAFSRFCLSPFSSILTISQSEEVS